MYDSLLTGQFSVDLLVAELPFLLLVLAMFWSGASRIRAAVAAISTISPPARRG